MQVIHDGRSAKDFKAVTFSGYSCAKAKTALQQAIRETQVEAANYWCAELVCAGKYGDAWLACIEYFTRHVHSASPALLHYLSRRLADFRAYAHEGTMGGATTTGGGGSLELRNDARVRELFCEVVCVLCDAPQQLELHELKLAKARAFDGAETDAHCVADALDYAQDCWRDGDPPELAVAANEFAFALRRRPAGAGGACGGTAAAACYWIEWIADYDRRCKADAEDPLRAAPRHFVRLAGAAATEVVWILWDAVLAECARRGDALLRKLALAALDLFCLHYVAGGFRTRRKLMLYAVVQLLAAPGPPSTHIACTQARVDAAKAKLDLVYGQIRAAAPRSASNLDYLFH
jgi:hypothetical protein